MKNFYLTTRYFYPGLFKSQIIFYPPWKKWSRKYVPRLTDFMFIFRFKSIWSLKLFTASSFNMFVENVVTFYCYELSFVNFDSDFFHQPGAQKNKQGTKMTLKKRTIFKTTQWSLTNEIRFLIDRVGVLQYKQLRFLSHINQALITN